MKIINLIFLSLLSLCLSFHLGAAEQPGLLASDLREALKNEFTGAYPEAREPTGTIKSFELVAA